MAPMTMTLGPSSCATVPEGRSRMSTSTAILDTEPTSYWPLTDDSGTTCHDEMALHDAVLNGSGGKLAVIPFGDASAPFFDGESGNNGRRITGEPALW